MDYVDFDTRLRRYQNAHNISTPKMAILLGVSKRKLRRIVYEQHREVSNELVGKLIALETGKATS